MEYDIGTIAGKIWNELETKGPRSPRNLQSSLKAKSDRIYLALGWLAREGKVQFNPTKTTFKVSLNQKK